VGAEEAGAPGDNASAHRRLRIEKGGRSRPS
jgi:hypothetical protein